MGLLFYFTRNFMQHSSNMKNIPRVDLNDFLSNNQEQKNRFVADLGNAFENIGFVILKGHYLTAEHTAKLYSQIKQFFASLFRKRNL